MNIALPAGEVRHALVVTAHPDDVDFGAAGTVAAWTAAGVKVSYCVCTSGEASVSAGLSREETARLRQAEQVAAAAEIGVVDVVFLDHSDGAVTPSMALRRDITRIIRTVRPDRVLTWSPEINWSHIVTSHPDHRAVGSATLAAIYPDAGNPRAHPELLEREGLDAWSVRELWLADSPPALRNHAVDVTDTFDKKMAALRSHRSQVGDAVELEDGLRAYLRRTAQEFGMPDGRLAESFQVVAMP